MSIAGGVDKAPERGRRATCDVIQLFTKSNLQWKAQPLAALQRKRFAANLERFAIQAAFAHACYLINLCSADSATRRRSWRALAVELRRCSMLGLPYLVLHPGSHGGQGERTGMTRILDGIARAIDRAGVAGAEAAPMLLLETTAGQRHSIGGRFEHLAELIQRASGFARLGVCFDTCHAFAAGYDLRTPEAYERTLAEFDRLVGIDRIKVFHLNDSRGPLGSHLDRHEHIGRGRIGRAGFRALLNDPRFAGHPMVIETPKGETPPARDVANLRRLRRMIDSRILQTGQRHRPSSM